MLAQGERLQTVGERALLAQRQREKDRSGSSSSSRAPQQSTGARLGLITHREHSAQMVSTVSITVRDANGAGKHTVSMIVRAGTQHGTSTLLKFDLAFDCSSTGNSAPHEIGGWIERQINPPMRSCTHRSLMHCCHGTSVETEHFLDLPAYQRNQRNSKEKPKKKTVSAVTYSRRVLKTVLLWMFLWSTGSCGFDCSLLHSIVCAQCGIAEARTAAHSLWEVDCNTVSDSGAAERGDVADRQSTEVQMYIQI
jgi:hypothetical protein